MIIEVHDAGDGQTSFLIARRVTRFREVGATGSRSTIVNLDDGTYVTVRERASDFKRLLEEALAPSKGKEI